MAFLGISYIFDRAENFTEFLDSLGIPDEQKQILISFKSRQSIKKDGDHYVLSSSKPEGGSKDLKFQPDVEFDEDIAPGVSGKTTFNVEGNVVTQVQKVGDLIVTYRREYSNDQLVVIMSSNKWDGESRRYYKAE